MLIISGETKREKVKDGKKRDDEMMMICDMLNVSNGRVDEKTFLRKGIPNLQQNFADLFVVVVVVGGGWRRPFFEKKVFFRQLVATKISLIK